MGTTRACEKIPTNVMTEHIETNWDSKTYVKQVGCGNLYVTLCYFKDQERKNKIEQVLITGDKNSMCGDSYNDVCADSLTYEIRRIRNHHEAIAICKNYRLQRCNNIVPNRDKTTSCADAIGQVIQTELGVSDDEIFGRV